MSESQIPLELKGVAWRPFLDTSHADLVTDLFVPALERSIRYDRGVGYFSSGWLRLAAQGLVAFAGRGGRARWVTSPILSPDDWSALQQGDTARYDVALREALLRNISEDLEVALALDTRSALAWMIADGVLTFRLALPRARLEQGDFHDKFGIFTDASGDMIAFNGSYNDSIQGTRNYESVKVFCSWEHDTWERFGKPDQDRFERLWNNMDPNVQVFDLPGAVRARILQLRQPSGRPYSLPELESSPWSERHGEAVVPRRPKIPADLVLKDYQVTANDAWFEHGCRGLMEMATGTGKTITALAASVRLFEREKRLALIVVAPYTHLAEQWVGEAAAFGWRCIKAYGTRSTYADRLQDRITAYRLGDTDVLAIATTYTTFSTQEFQNALSDIGGPSLLVADEAHHMGAEARRASLPEAMQFRLALSATPERWFDEAGTRAIYDYFGSTVFRLTLSDAIGISLTPYYYYPVLVELTSEEMERYKALSAKISRAMFAGKKGEQSKGGPMDDRLSRLLIERARLVNNADNKISAAADLVDQYVSKLGIPLSHALFYCAPGDGQLDSVARMLAFEKCLPVHTFTSEENMVTRKRLLLEFSRGELAALVAMKCLDEGVDVPSTKVAFLLASSSNPREFIQRRGRVLRRSPGKEYAVVYDLITAPPPPEAMADDTDSLYAERALLRRELRRFAEFADSAMNAVAAYETIWRLADQYGVLDFREDTSRHGMLG